MCSRAIVSVAVACVAALVVAPAAGAQTGSEDSVRGFAQITGYPFPQMSVDAHSGPAGENPIGTFSASLSARSLSWTFSSSAVTCVAVAGNQALVVGTGTYRTTTVDPVTGLPIPPRTTWFSLYVQDNGPPIFEPPVLESRDVASYVFPDTQPACTVPAVPPPPTQGQFSSVGDLIVHDAPALPTTKEQCKNGGWTNFGSMFKSPGQCVAFVERGPKS